MQENYRKEHLRRDQKKDVCWNYYTKDLFCVEVIFVMYTLEKSLPISIPFKGVRWEGNLLCRSFFCHVNFRKKFTNFYPPQGG